MSNIVLTIVPGKSAPRYLKATELNNTEVVITEQATEAGLPIVDFVCRDNTGKLYLLVMSGRLVNMISAAVKGVNVRNHGKEEP
jgi:hypothetical protein